MSYYGFRPYVPVAKRRANALKQVQKLAKNGRKVSPVVIEGRKIASNFWGKAWCDNLEGYSDYENRLPRGRTYVRNGSVIDLQIERGQIRAMVSGSDIYSISIDIATLPRSSWASICADCSGSVGSLVELLQGKLSKNVMERVCRAGDGLFPSPREIKMRCSCPDSAAMCKHISAVLYGVGARLDAAPDVLFALRGVDRSELIAEAGANLPIAATPVASERIVAEDDLAALFGIDMAPTPDRTEPRSLAKPATPPPAAPREVAAMRGAGQPPVAKPGKTARAAPSRIMTAPKSIGRDRASAASNVVELRDVRKRIGSTAGSPRKPTQKTSAVAEPPASPPEPSSRRRTPALAGKWARWKKEKAR